MSNSQYIVYSITLYFEPVVLSEARSAKSKESDTTYSPATLGLFCLRTQLSLGFAAPS